MASATKTPPVQSLLRAPGLGLLTVTTGGQAQQAFLAKHWPGRDASEWPLEIRERLKTFRAKAPPFVFLGVPSDAGGGVCRGAAHGPAALRAQMLQKGRLCFAHDLGDIPCIPQLTHDSILNAHQLRASGRALWGPEYRAGWPVSPLNLTEEILVSLLRGSKPLRPLVVGGDHSVSGAVFAALARVKKLRGLAVLHVDAHTDLLESRYGIEHCFATWTAHAVRQLPKPAAWVQVGVRTSGRTKAEWEAHYGLRQIWAHEANPRDPDDFARELVRHWFALGCRSLYVSLDVDGVDAGEIPSTGTPEPAGLRSEWLARVLARVTRALPLIGADVMELAPVLGAPADAERSVETAARLVESLAWPS